MPTTVEKSETHLKAIHQLCADAWLDVADLGADPEEVHRLTDEL